MQSNGFIHLHRKLVDWEWYEDLPTRALFIHLLLTVNWQDKKWRGMTIKRGSIITSRNQLAKKVGISEQSLRTALANLQINQEVTSKTTNRYTLISVNKYDDYQPINQQINQPIHRQSTTTKEYKNKESITNVILPAEKITFKSIDDITPEVVAQVATQYSVPAYAVSKELESLRLYCLSKGTKYKDYRATLQGWVRRKIDEGKIKQGRTPQEGKVAGVLESLERKYANNQ